jgi:hypothetical protein
MDNYFLNAWIYSHTYVRKYDHGGLNNNINKAHLVSNPWENIDTFKLVQSDLKSANYFPKKSCVKVCKAKLLLKKLFVLKNKLK